jgi:hypothetical protein
MNISTRIDLQNIYDNQIKPTELLNQFIQVLDSLEAMYSERAGLRTRNVDNKILSSSSIKYFTFDKLSSKSEPDEVIFAGSMEKPPRDNKSPIVRVRNGNTNLARIPVSFKFPFTRERNPGWTSVVISSATIDMFRDLLHSEVENYFSSHQGHTHAIR